MGRNIWQSDYPIAMLKAVRAIVHENFNFKESCDLFNRELKVKESNRLELIRHNLHNCGIFCKVNDEDLYIDPTKKINLKENRIKTDDDHRIAMSFAVMGTRLGGELKITNSEFIKTSFPDFLVTLNSVGGNLSE